MLLKGNSVINVSEMVLEICVLDLDRIFPQQNNYGSNLESSLHCSID